MEQEIEGIKITFETVAGFKEALKKKADELNARLEQIEVERVKLRKAHKGILKILDEKEPDGGVGAAGKAAS
ncbi:MAG: hypothetical protein A2V88_09260 [Elusimicrobia bacterium RBG_16_66_12]|nr:MAG: hypothetical protein A2V88_09260 [Elusimicrobia bacterium RBG_16_66_12]